MKIYIIGSLRNPSLTKLANKLRKDFPNIDFWMAWFGAGYEADDKWQAYEQSKGLSYVEALDGDNAHHVWSYDKKHLDEAQAAILALPAGKSGHLELGYMVGQGKSTVIHLPSEPDRWDVMYRFANFVTTDYKGLKGAVEQIERKHVYSPEENPFTLENQWRMR